MMVEASMVACMDLAQVVEENAAIAFCVLHTATRTAMLMVVYMHSYYRGRQKT